MRLCLSKLVFAHVPSCCYLNTTLFFFLEFVLVLKFIIITLLLSLAFNSFVYLYRFAFYRLSRITKDQLF